MNRIRLAIFDLDGTTADTLCGIQKGLNQALAACHYPTLDREGVRRSVNFTVREFVARSLPADVQTNPSEIDRVMGLYDAYYRDTYHLTVPFDGMADLMESLHRDGCLLAMNSNKQDAFVKILSEELFRPGLFLAAEGFRTDRPGKPDPSVALDIMHRASALCGTVLTPDRCAYIGDSDVDYRTAVNAGMYPVSVSWGYRDEAFLRSLGDQPIAHTTAELSEILHALDA